MLLTTTQGWSQFDDVQYESRPYYDVDALEAPVAEEFSSWLVDEPRGLAVDFDHSNAACVDHCCGRFAASVGPVLFKRERMDDVPLVINNNGAGPTVLNAGDFAFDYEAGIDAGITYHRCDWPMALESRYLWINDWNSTRSATGLTNPAINTNPLSSNFGAPNFTATYQSQFQSFEFQSAPTMLRPHLRAGRLWIHKLR